MARLKTLGRPHVVDDAGAEIPLQPLPLAVLAYLARSGPRDRDHLAALFWHNTKNGLNSLSTTLNRIRAVLPDAVWVEGTTLVGTNMASDVADLTEAIDRSDFDTVTQLYNASFLGSLKLRQQSAEFEEWVLSERTTLASMVELFMLQRASDLFEATDYGAAADAAENAWNVATRDGFPSPDCFEMYHRILASDARASANAVRTLADEFDIALAPVEPIAFDVRAPGSAGDTAAGTADVSPPREQLPSPSTTTQLFGCEEELVAIAASVASQQLTTIIGLGGSGKTRLAAEYFGSTRAAEYFDTRHWVSLGEVVDADLVGPAIATSLGRRFTDIAQLADGFPDDKPILLVLDNLEQIPLAAPAIAELAHHNQALRILATSRVPLQVEHESLVQLAGLDWAEGDLDSPAAQLFLSSARRAGVSDDRLLGSNPSAVLDVCRRVGGNPLSLEIAGGWAQVLSPPEICDALDMNDDLLGTPMSRGLRGMDVVLTQSWATLSDTERDTLMLLATFRGGCLTKEALTLPQLSIASIGSLVQHSLVWLHVEGRITLHPLIAGHALAELEKRPELDQAFHQILNTWCQHFATRDDAVASLGLESEIANFTSAWSWNARHGLWDLHRTTLAPLRQFFTDSGRVAEGKALFAATADTLRSDPDHDRGLLARMLEAIGWCQIMAGEVNQARTLLDEAFALGTNSNPHEQAQLRRTLGQLDLVTGEVDAAITHFEAGLDLTIDDQTPLTTALQYDLAQAHHYSGRHEQAAGAARSALRAGRAANDSTVMVRSYILLADIEVATDPQRAVVLANEGLAIAQEASLDQFAIYFPHLLGQAHLQLSNAELAESHFGDGLVAATEIGQSFTVCANHFGRAEARLLRSDAAGAIDDLTTGIRLALKIGSVRLLAWAAAVSCRLILTEEAGADEQARELLLMVLAHPGADRSARDKAEATWQDFFDGAPPHEVPADDGSVATPDEITEAALELLTLSSANEPVVQQSGV